MDFKQTFFNINGKISGLSYLIRTFLIAISISAVAVAIRYSLDIDGTGDGMTLISWGIILCFWLIQDKKRINAVIKNRSANIILFIMLVINYLFLFLKFYDCYMLNVCEPSGGFVEGYNYFSYALHLYLVFWNGKYESKEEAKFANRIFNRNTKKKTVTLKNQKSKEKSESEVFTKMDSEAIEELKKLKELLDLNLITKEEFDKKSKELKKIILGN